jgi:putative addiction module component (TIGR02574 family)
LEDARDHPLRGDVNSTLYDEIVKLDAATRFQLAQDLLDSVASETFATPLTPEHRAELRDRLAHHRAHPDEPTVTLAEIKSKAGIE